MKNIFILEDDDRRIEIFQEKLAKHNLTVAKDVRQAKEFFSNNSVFDILFLDHDLGGRKNVDPKEENTGYQFIQWVAEYYDMRDYYVVVHSMNPVGAISMIKYAPFGARIPFTFLVDELYKV